MTDIDRRTKKQLQNAFDKVDLNRDKKLSWEEIKLCCESIKIIVRRQDYLAFLDCDVNHDGTLDFDEFCLFAYSRLQSVFNEIDEDKNGRLDQYEIQKVLQKLAIHLTMREIQAILYGMDQDGDHEIDFHEFCDFFADVPTLDIRTVASRWMCGIGIDVGVDQMPDPIPPVDIPIYRYMFSGALAQIVSKTAVAPLEKIKIMSQVSGRLKVTATMKRIFSNEGVRGLYAGNLTNCLRLLPNRAIVATVYSGMIKYTPVDDIKNPHQPAWRCFSGASAGFVSSAATYPLDVVRTRLTVQDSSKHNLSRYTGIIPTMKRITSEEGFRGLYRGMSPSLLAIVPFIGIQQASYDVMKLGFVDTQYEKSSAIFLLCGITAGTIAQTIVHPLEVTRRYMQMDHNTTYKSLKQEIRKRSFRNALKLLWKSGGIPRIFAGLSAAYLKILPSATISLFIRDKLLGRH